jgi:hypothetical protein
VVIQGSRGAAAAALQLDYHVDDSPRNCVDIQAASSAKLLLVIDPADLATVQSARRLRIGTAGTIADCLGILEQAQLQHTHPKLLKRLGKLVGWTQTANRKP